MPLQVRPTAQEDHLPVLEVVRSAFASGPGEGTEEVDIVAAVWRRGAAPPGLDLVAEEDGAVVGHVMASRGQVGGETVLGVAPLAVRPDRWARGIGHALMDELVGRARGQGWARLVLLGAPAYYGRFGFAPAGAWGLHYQPVGVDDPHFMVLVLDPSAPAGAGGFYRYSWELEP